MLQLIYVCIFKNQEKLKLKNDEKENVYEIHMKIILSATSTS